jgi:hypothetical protein
MKTKTAISKTAMWVGGLGLFFCASSLAQTFSFALLADPHITSGAERREQLKTAVNWIITNHQSKKIELVFVLGDIAWGGSGDQRYLKVAKELLDPLNEAGIPYVPILGDNEVQEHCVKEFEETFRPQYELLAGIMFNFNKMSIPIQQLYLQNFSFDYKDCHFVCPDFLSRVNGEEGGELHQWEGGSWQWFRRDIETCDKRKKENIIVFTHIGMYTTGVPAFDQFLFTWDEMKIIKDFLLPYRDNIAANYAGHIHQNWHSVVRGGLLTPIYDTWMTDETWFSPPGYDKEITVRRVEVNTDGNEITYQQHIENCSALKNSKKVE